MSLLTTWYPQVPTDLEDAILSGLSLANCIPPFRPRLIPLQAETGLAVELDMISRAREGDCLAEWKGQDPLCLWPSRLDVEVKRSCRQESAHIKGPLLAGPEDA